MDASAGSRSCSFADLPEEFLLLHSRQKAEEAEHRKKQNLRITVLEVRSSEEIRADHLQAIAA